MKLGIYSSSQKGENIFNCAEILTKRRLAKVCNYTVGNRDPTLIRKQWNFFKINTARLEPASSRATSWCTLYTRSDLCCYRYALNDLSVWLADYQ